MSYEAQSDADRYGNHGWIDRHGDVWRLEDDGLLHTPETKPFPGEFVERKWGPLRKVVSAAEASDKDRVRAELRNRIDHAREVGVDFEAVLRTVAHEQPDAVNDALDAEGAPS